MGIKSQEKKNVESTAETDSAQKKKSRRAAGLLAARKNGETVSSFKLMSKGALSIAAGLIVLMGASFMASALVSRQGAFVIRAQQAYEIGEDVGIISLSETEGFSNPSINLTAKAIDEMDNITYEWLPFEELDAHDGCYNGENYIAYTFYIKNTGTGDLYYDACLEIADCSRRIDEAVRVMIYKNGEPTVYARPTESGAKEAYPKDLVNFYSENKVMAEGAEHLKADEINRYTVVVWLEGEDPECVDSVRGGTMKMEMLFTALAGEGESGFEMTDKI